MLVTMPEDRYPKKLFSQDWNIKPHRGRQRKVWSIISLCHWNLKIIIIILNPLL